MTKIQRALILAKTNGRCAYCGIPLEGVRWHADHFKPVKRELAWKSGIGITTTSKFENPENHTIDNMLASCPSCNIAKSSLHIEAFREIIEDKLNMLASIPNYQIAKRYGLLKEEPHKITFYFEELGLF